MTNASMNRLETNFTDIMKKRKKRQAELESSHLKEKEVQEKIEENPKDQMKKPKALLDAVTNQHFTL